MCGVFAPFYKLVVVIMCVIHISVITITAIITHNIIIMHYSYITINRACEVAYGTNATYYLWEGRPTFAYF